jgi:hypothetical protein
MEAHVDEGDIRARTSEVLPACAINHVLCKCNKHDNEAIEMQAHTGKVGGWSGGGCVDGFSLCFHRLKTIESNVQELFCHSEGKIGGENKEKMELFRYA